MPAAARGDGTDPREDLHAVPSRGSARLTSRERLLPSCKLGESPGSGRMRQLPGRRLGVPIVQDLEAPMLPTGGLGVSVRGRTSVPASSTSKRGLRQLAKGTECPPW